MKKLTTLFLSISLLFFLSCSDDEEDFLTPLVGTWETYTMVSSGCTDPDENGILTCTGAPCFSVTITSSGTYTLNNNLDQTIDSGTVTVTATTITLCENGDTDCEGENYTLSGNTLTITFTEDDSPGCLFTLTFTKQ